MFAVRVSAAAAAMLWLYQLAIAADKAVTILQKNCASCHGATQMSGFDVRRRDAILRGGKRGPAVVPGHSADSLLYRAVSRDGDLKMPPGKSGLSAEELASIRAWIDAGAPWDNGGDKVESAWWSFRSPTRPAIPKTARRHVWIRNPIDAFILAKLEDKRLKPAPPASKLSPGPASLLRSSRTPSDARAK